MFNFVMNIFDKIDDCGPALKSFFQALIVVFVTGFVLGYVYIMILLPLTYSIIMFVFAAFLVLWGRIYVDNISSNDESDDKLDAEVDEYINADR